MSDSQSVVEFIEGRLLEIQSIGGKYPYLGFTLVCQGIEFLGACLDELPFTEKDLSENRFRKAMDGLFPNNYAAFIRAGSRCYLYEQLRCGLVHTLKPQSQIALTTRNENKGKHLNQDERGRTILCFEDFVEDYAVACKKVITKIKAKRLTNPKVHGDYLNITGGLSGC